MKQFFDVSNIYRLGLRALYCCCAALSLMAAHTQAGAPIGKEVRILTSAGKYVCADIAKNGQITKLFANRDKALDWETFKVVGTGVSGVVGLKAKANNLFVSADINLNADNPPLVADREALGPWEKFEWIENGDGTVSLIAQVNGLYVANEQFEDDARLVANRSKKGSWEKYRVEVVEGSTGKKDISKLGLKFVDDLQFETATMSSEGGVKQHGSYKISEDGRTYSAYIESELNKMVKPAIVSNNAYQGQKSLVFAAKNTQEWDKQRTEYFVESIYFDKKEWYMEYAFKIDSASSPPDDFAIINQFWQGPGGVGLNPPLETMIMPDGKGGYLLSSIARNNDTLNYFEDTEGAEPIELVNERIKEGTFYQVVMNFVPSYNGDGISGKFRMWLNGKLVSNFDKIEIGYNPTKPVDSDDKAPDDFLPPDDFLHNKIGIYRYGPEKFFKIYFDNIRLGYIR